MTFKQNHVSLPISGGGRAVLLFSLPFFFLFSPFLFRIPDPEAGLLAQRSDQISQSKCAIIST